MYNYRIPKDQWWSFCKAVRDYYLAHHPVMQIVRSIKAKDGVGLYTTVSRVADALGDWTVDLQLFDEGDTYLIRPLEHGYFFLNKREKFSDGFDLADVFYNNSTDVPPEEEKNKKVSQWSDKKIRAREYLMYPLLNKDDFMDYAFAEIFKRDLAGNNV